MKKSNNQNSNLRKYEQTALSPLLSQFFSDDEYLTAIATVLSNRKTGEEFRSVVKKLLGQKRFQLTLSATYPLNAPKTEHSVFKQGFDDEKHFEFIATVLGHYSNKLSTFARARDLYERYLLNADYQNAENTLNALEQEHGVSFWSVRARTTMWSYQGCQAEIPEYCAKIKSQQSHHLFVTLIEYLQLFSDSDKNDCLQLHDSLIERNITEFAEANWHEMSVLLKVLFSPHAKFSSTRLTECLPLVQVFPLIDQYVIFQTLLTHLVIDKHSTICQNVTQELMRLNESISDTQLNRICKSLTNQELPNRSKIGNEILELYEIGAYETAISVFEQNIPALENPISYVNLIAKSYAYLGRVPAQQGGVVADLVHTLAPLYLLEKEHRTVEANLWSRVISLRGLVICPCAELAIYLALPNLYLNSAVQRAASISALCSVEFTPTVECLLLATDGKFGSRYSRMPEVAIDYRRTKKLLFNEIIKDDRNENRIDELFQEFRLTSPLLKDYLELHSEYCVYTSKFELLLDECANYLVQNPNLYACFPVGYLTSNIEARFCHSLNAVVVMFYLSPHLSPSFSRLMTELFEEYLMSCDVTRPSELLNKQNTLNSLELVFYRDICIPDIMDCLPCFSDIAELRAERILLLDTLVKLNYIDRQTSSEEVEEIIGKHIVERVTAGINSAKIHVDVDAIQREISQEAAALFSSFKQLPAQSEERMTVLRSDEKSEDLSVYTTGARNSLVVKLINLHTKPFLFDEEHGLDKNLSTEIRHGFFSNLMRSILQENFLITEIGEDGEYASNQHWREIHSLVTDEIWDEVDAALKDFSVGFNDLIRQAEEWMKIRFTKDEPSRRFVYETPLEEFQAVLDFMEQAQQPSDVSDYIMSQLLNRTEVILEEMRDLLHSSFQNDLNNLFEKLVSDITIAKRGAAFVELIAVITKVKGEIKERVVTAAEWFRSATQLDMEVIPIDKAIHIAAETFKGVNGSKGGIQLNLNTSLKSVHLPGKSIKPLTIAIFNLLNNCYQHSGLGLKVEVSIHGASTSSGGASIKLVNNVDADIASSLTPAAMSIIKQRFSIEPSLKLMRTEGGSGLAKAYHQISTVGSSSSLSVSLENSRFISEIHYVP